MIRKSSPVAGRGRKRAAKVVARRKRASPPYSTGRRTRCPASGFDSVGATSDTHPCRLTSYGADAGHRAGAMDYALAGARLPALRARPHRPERRLGVRVFSGRFAHAGTAVARGAHRVCPNPGAVAARSAAQTQRPRAPLRPPPRPAPAALDAESRRVAQDRPFPSGRGPGNASNASLDPRARPPSRRSCPWPALHDAHRAAYCCSTTPSPVDGVIQDACAAQFASRSHPAGGRSGPLMNDPR